jgi:hypothetical protein
VVQVAAASEGYATLDAGTDWRLVLTITPPSTTESAADIPSDAPKVNVALHVRFLEEQGYEPPSGTLQVLDDERGFLNTAAGDFRWQLSEEEGTDPLDKGGLWIWGLFKEPLYPLLRLELETNGLEWPSGAKFPAGRLNVTLPHARSKTRGTVLSPGSLAVRQVVQYDADLVGLSKANVSELRPCGEGRADAVL